MSYRRALMVTDLAGHEEAALSALHRLAPELELLLVAVRLPPSTSVSAASATEVEEAALSALARLREAARAGAARVEVELAPELNAEALSDMATRADIDLLVFGARSRKVLALLTSVQKRHAIALLASDAPTKAEPITDIYCVALGQRGRDSIGAFLRDHVSATTRVTLLSPGGPPPDELKALLHIAGIDMPIETPELDAAALRSWLDAGPSAAATDLFVFARVPASLVLSTMRFPAPVLLLPPSPWVRPLFQRAIDVPDIVDDGGPLRVRVDYVATVGQLVPVPDQPMSFAARGRVWATTATEAGAVELPPGLEAHSLGVFRASDDTPIDILAATEQWVTVIRPGEEPLVLFDAELPEPALRVLADLSIRADLAVLAVRLRPTRSCRAIRDQLRRLGLWSRVADARAVLDEGAALDVSELHDGVRLARVAAKLRAHGFPVTAIAHRCPVEPFCRGVRVWGAAELSSGAVERAIWAEAAGKREPSLESLPSEATCGPFAGSPLFTGNHIEVELDNARARELLLDAIERSTETVHLQVYMAGDDHVGAAVEHALARAGARGVRVRVLVDSLHGLHGSFGISNPLLERLARLPGVEVRTAHPINEAPSLAALKQRDHRKLVVVDGRLALVGGRNLSHEYYTGFGETRLDASSPWREVPWLDAGARVEGPLVVALSCAFLEAWVEAGGEGFSLVAPEVRGTMAARVVAHRGLRDARTLEAHRELIDTAESHIYVVNGFPLMLELQHALVRALRRGVRVHSLVGHVTPIHDGEPFRGPWGPARMAATELVHSRFDALSEAGGETYLFAVRNVPGWDPALGIVYPHVHAKLMSVDGKRCAVGSANLDITSAYWESELMLILEDTALCRGVEARLDELLRASVRIDRDDPTYQQLARRRAWMRHWPGVLSL